MPTAMPVCASCGERSAMSQDPGLCARCVRKREDDARHAREYRAREKARKAGPPERIDLDSEQTLAFVAAVRVLDAAREVLHADDAFVGGRDRGDLPARMALEVTASLFSLADAYDVALGLLRRAVPPAALPSGERPRPRVSDATRALLDAPAAPDRR